MTAPPDPDSLASLRAKWSQARPELDIALRFIAPPQRVVAEAMACLGLELEQAAFELHDVEPALIKLQWWAQELIAAGHGQASHPLACALAAQPGFAAVAPAQWQALVEGALRQRDDAPAPTAVALLDGHAALQAPLAQIQVRLGAPLDAPALGRARILARALRELARLHETLADGRLPLPLDLLARHRLARGDLAQATPRRRAAVRDWLAELATGLAALRGARIGAIAAAGVAADRWRIARARRSDEPVAMLGTLLARVPLRATLAAWRARGA